MRRCRGRQVELSAKTLRLKSSRADPRHFPCWIRHDYRTTGLQRANEEIERLPLVVSETPAGSRFQRHLPCFAGQRCATSMHNGSGDGLARSTSYPPTAPAIRQQRLSHDYHPPGKRSHRRLGLSHCPAQRYGSNILSSLHNRAGRLLHRVDHRARLPSRLRCFHMCPSIRWIGGKVCRRVWL